MSATSAGGMGRGWLANGMGGDSVRRYEIPLRACVDCCDWSYESGCLGGGLETGGGAAVYAVGEGCDGAESAAGISAAADGSQGVVESQRALGLCDRGEGC